MDKVEEKELHIFECKKGGKKCLECHLYRLILLIKVNDNIK